MVERMISSRRASLHAKTIECRHINFSKTEVIDLAKAWTAISIAFAIVMGGLQESSFLSVFLVAAFTVGLGFLAHEMAHKFVAQKYGCCAEFRAFNEMLIFAIFMSFFGAVFAAPGAVMISGSVSKKQNGKIALAGPFTNVILALLFLLIASISVSGIINEISSFGFTINAWLALFNMIPLWQFDGLKVFQWNKAVYFIFLAASLFLVFGLHLII